MPPNQDNTNTEYKLTKSNYHFGENSYSITPEHFQIAFHGMWCCSASHSDHWNDFKINTSVCTKSSKGRSSPRSPSRTCKYTLSPLHVPRRKVIFHGLFALCCLWFLLCSSMEILNDPNDGTQECGGRCLTFLQKLPSPLQSHQRCISKASLEPESDCRKGIFATLTLTLPIQ